MSLKMIDSDGEWSVPYMAGARDCGNLWAIKDDRVAMGVQVIG